MTSPELGEAEAQQAHDYMYAIGSLTVRFADVLRATHMPDGRDENDAEHSFHLGLTAVELAATFYPHLDSGLVAKFTMVHDLPEVYAGDVPTVNITEEQRAAKEAAELAATERLMKELPPHLADLLRRYELQEEPEARFVRFVDKLLPAVMNVMADDPERYKAEHKLETYEKYLATRALNTERLQRMYPEFPFLHLVRDLSSKTMAEFMYGTSQGM